MNLKKIGAIMMSAAVAVSASGITTLAATQNYANGVYSGTTNTWYLGKPGTPSMSNNFFNGYAEVEVTDNNTNITLRALSPDAENATFGDIKITYDGTDYAGTVTDGEGTMTALNDIDMVGIKAGEEYSFQEIDFSLPADAVDYLDDGMTIGAFVTLMNSSVDATLTITDLVSTGTTEPEGNSQDMEITATVEEKASEPSYTVTVPSSVALGTLSADADNSKEYAVNVAAKDLNGTISVSAPEAGSLTSSDKTLAFANSFGTQTVTEDTEGTDLSGAISVKAADVAAAAAGDYTGTTTFSISYAAN